MVKKIRKTGIIISVGALAFIILLAPFNLGQNHFNEVKGTPAGWSDDIQLSKDGLTHVDCAITTYQDDIHVVWEQYDPGSSDDYIVYKKSNDSGITWKSSDNISNPDYVAVHPDVGSWNQNIHIAWEDYRAGSPRIYYRNSTNWGESWNLEKRISSTAGFFSCGPKLFINNTNVHLIWLDLRGSDQEMYYRRSLDGGTTFDNGQGINEDRRLTFASTDVSYIEMNGENDNISVLWCDESSGGDWDIYWMISKDNGYTWDNGIGTPNVGRLISDDSSTSVSPAIAVNGSNIHIVWVDEQWPGPVYRLYYRNSTNNGFSWNSIQLLTGPVPGINSPGISVEGNNIFVVWDDERDDGSTEQIYYKYSANCGNTWSNDTRLTFGLPMSCYHPRINAVNGTNHVVWYSDEIYYKRSPDFPDTTAPSHSNEIPLPDSFKDAPGTNISVQVTDPSGVNASTIQLRVNGSLISHTLTPIIDGYNVSWTSGGFGSGVVTCRIIAADMLGNILDYSWNFTVLANTIIPLQEGWNLISLPLEQVDTSIPNVMASIDGKWDVIKYYDTLDAADPWKSYRPGGTANDLAEIDNTMGFWIKITEPGVDLTVRGIIPVYTTIPLYAGWNLVGYPTQTTETVGNALWGTGADRVEVFDPVSPYIKEVGATYVMKPGEGYWVHVTADTTWTINW